MIRPANSSRAAKAVLAVVALVLLSSCASLPRIIILHDALTPEEHLNLGVAYEKKGDLDAAMKQYRAASKKLPVAYEYMGNVCFGKKDFSQAEKYYKKAIEKDPGNPDAYNNLAWLYYTEKIKMDDALRQLIAMAPEKSELESGRIIPQMETAIQHTEEEMAKVVARIEAMLAGSDATFQNMVRLKQEANLGRLPGQEALLAELEKNTQAIQDALFGLLQQIQFQDIARQKLERVLNHIRGLQLAIGQKFRDMGGQKG